MKTRRERSWGGAAGVLALVLAVLAGSAQCASKKGTTVTGTNEPYAQTTYDPSDAVDVGFNGTQCTLHGLDYNSDGQTLNYVDPVTPATGTTFQDLVLGTAPNTITYKVGYVQTTTPSGQPVSIKSGTMYRVDTVSNQQKWVQIVPGAALMQGTVGMINGTSDASPIGMNIDGTHNDNQLIGGVTNEESNRTASLEGLVRACKDAATKTIDLSTANCFTSNDGSFGTPTSPAIVYASGKKNADGSYDEDGIHFSGTFQGYGVLVMEIDDPENCTPCGLMMSGTSTWTGLVITVFTKNPTGNKQPLEFVGGGQDYHIIGGAFLYMRNQKRNASDSSSLIGKELVKLAGNGDIRYSDAAIDAAFKMKPTAMQVRSWRKLGENE